MPVKYLNTSTFTTNFPLVERFFDENPVRNDLVVFFQDEHNLVLSGGRDLPRRDPVGNIRSIFDPDQKYRVRIVNKPLYFSSDIVIEYNQPNIENIKRSRVLPPEVLRKIIYAPALPFEYHKGHARHLPLITNVINEDEPRRAFMIEMLSKRCAGYRNVKGIYDLQGVCGLYSSAKVILNFRQTWHHHTIEEFRILPALCRGCIVISEDVPLREQIPYHEYVIWCAYDELPDVALDVLCRYETYFERIHGESSGLEALFNRMKYEFEGSLKAILSSREHFSTTARLKRRSARMIGALRCPRNKIVRALRKLKRPRA